MRIREGQIERLDTAVRETARADTASFLRRTAADQVAHLDDQALAASILAGEELAMVSGVTIEQGFDLFGMLHALFGPGFMEEEPMKDYFAQAGCTMNDKVLILLKTWEDVEPRGGE